MRARRVSERLARWRAGCPSFATDGALGVVTAVGYTSRAGLAIAVPALSEVEVRQLRSAGGHHRRNHLPIGLLRPMVPPDFGVFERSRESRMRQILARVKSGVMVSYHCDIRA